MPRTTAVIGIGTAVAGSATAAGRPSAVAGKVDQPRRALRYGGRMAKLIDLPHLYSGKVRDIYDAGDKRLLLVTSDRMSAFDVVMAEPIPDKGRVLTAMSAFWFDHF